MVGEKTSKFSRTTTKDVWLGRLLKSPIFIAQKATAPHQKSIGVIRCSLATSYNDVRRRLKFSRTNKQTDGRMKPRIEVVHT